MNTVKHLALCLLLTALAGCTVGPDYVAPNIQAPEKFVSQGVLDELNQGQGNATLPEKWWEGFSDPTLTGLVEDALKHNNQIASSLAALREARARVILAEAGNNVSATASVGGNGEEKYENSSGTNIVTGTSDIGITVPWDIFGKTRRDVEAAQAGVQAADSAFRGLVLDISSRVVSEYLKLRGNQRQLALLEQSVKLQNQTLSIVTTRYKAGLSPELDMHRAETSVDRLSAQLPPLRQALLNSRNRLATLTGHYPGIYEKSLQAGRKIPSYDAHIPDLIPLDVLTKRPDVQQAEAGLKSAIARIGVAQAELYPTFQLAGRISIGPSSGGTPTTRLTASLIALIQQIVLRDNGTLKANVEIARARAEAALLDYKQTLLDACRDVETSLAAIKYSRQSQASLDQAVTSSSRSFHEAESLYQQGLIGFLDVVDAQRTLADAEQALAAERTNYATQIAGLFRALGTRVDMNKEATQTVAEPSGSKRER